MSSKPHLQIFTSSPATDDKESNFSLFSLLPHEIRLQIWLYSLRRQRIINLILEAQTGNQADPSTTPDSKSERYRTVVHGYQVLSKLLRVNTESRQAALEFCRVHLPCEFMRGTTREETTKPGTLHYNPEYDFLRINSRPPVKDTLVNFLFHLKTHHDPQSIGLLNLAVDVNDLNANDLYLLKPSDLNPVVKKAFIETLTQLHEVFFVSQPRVGRQIVGIHSGISTNETIFNRSFPIMAMTPSFERLHRDPRPISQDLKKVYVGLGDQRHMLHLWHQLLKKWEISPLKIEYRFYLAFVPVGEGNQIYNRGRAERWLQKEDDEWTGAIWDQEPSDGTFDQHFARFWKEKGIQFPIGAESEEYKNEDLEKVVRPAIGFWLFPIEVLGPIPEEGVEEDEGLRSRSKLLLDMSGYWPELALLSLP